MRIIVTGGSGFLGSAFVRRSRQAGHQVAVLSRGGLGVPEGTTWLPGGISDPPWKEIERFRADGLPACGMDCNTWRVSGIARK